MRATAIKKVLNEKKHLPIGQVISLSYDIVKAHGGS